jgi:hypothetical protein
MEQVMDDNLEHWNRFADIDPKFTKPITGKDYSGTSPNPQYVIRCLTELFGPVGQGFGWHVVADGFQDMGETTLHWCRIEFWHTDRSNTFEAYGQTKAAYMTKGGFHRVDEDAPKKSLTDAVIKAASQIGIAANIFLGRWDDQKYVAQVNQEYRKEEAAKVDHTEHVTRLANCDTLAELRHVWGELGKELHRVPEILAAKDKRKAELEADAEHDKAVKGQ